MVLLIWGTDYLGVIWGIYSIFVKWKRKWNSRRPSDLAMNGFGVRGVRAWGDLGFRGLGLRV